MADEDDPASAAERDRTDALSGWRAARLPEAEPAEAESVDDAPSAD
jgi:hypothetical protein